MGNHQSGNKRNIKKSKSECNITSDNTTTTPGQTSKQTPQYNKSKSIPNKHQISNHISVSTYQVPGNNYNVSSSVNVSDKNNNSPSIWFNIKVKNQENSNEKKSIEGIYRKVEFIDTMLDRQTKDGSKMDNIMPNISEYSNYYTSDGNVYVKIYNWCEKQLDQKHENIFLWNDGFKWIFSNYNTLFYYLDNIQCKKKWVIKPETNINNLLISYYKYSNDLNILKQNDKIIFQNAINNDFELIINNYYGKHYSKHQQQFEEDPSLRNIYGIWRDNLNIIYARNQLFTMNELVNEEKEYYNKREAKDVLKIIDEINDICLSMQFRKLLKKYKHKSIKINGWKNKGEIEMHICDGTYTQFYNSNINQKGNKQLGDMNIKDVVLQFHKYYCQLFTELNELDQFLKGAVTYK